MGRFVADSSNQDQLRMRLEEKVVKSASCWIWRGATNSSGYGVINIHGRSGPQVRAHRLSFYLANGLAPEVVMHACDVPSCVNPKHLVAGSLTLNALDRDLKNRVSHGERHYNSTLTERDVTDIRKRYFFGNETQRDIANDYGIHRVTVGKIVRGVNWKRNRGEQHVNS